MSMPSIVRNAGSSEPSGRLRFGDMSDEERIAHLGSFIVETPQFLSAKKALVRTYRGWRTTTEGTFAMLTGPSGAGKTTIADDFVQDLGEEWEGAVTDGDAEITDPDGVLPDTVGVTKQGPTGLIRPLIKVFVAPKARARDLLRDTLRALGIRAAHHDTFGELMTTLQLHLARQKVRMIIFDEVHHIVEGHGPTTAYEAAEVIKMLLLQARTQIVCVGLPHSESILTKNPELPRHVRGRYALHALDDRVNDPTSEYMRFLKALSSDLPFDRPSDLASTGTALRVHVATQGYIGRITNLVQAACTLAIEDGLDRLTTAKLVQAFGDIEGVGLEENPFHIEGCDEATFAPVRRRIEERRRRAVDATRRSDDGTGAFTRRNPKCDFKK